jgi:hypothetical protein
MIAVRLFCEGKKFVARGTRAEWFALLACVVLGFLADGWRAEVPGPELRENFARWSTDIGELQHLDPTGPLLWGWLGLLIVLAPVLLCLAGLQDFRIGAHLQCSRELCCC